MEEKKAIVLTRKELQEDYASFANFLVDEFRVKITFNKPK